MLPLASILPGAALARSGSLKRFFMAGRNRFPAYGGHAIPAGQPCQLAVVPGFEANGAKPDTAIFPVPGGFVPAAGAILDVTMTLRTDP